MELKIANLTTDYASVITTLLTEGNDVEVRDLPTVELTNVTLVSSDPSAPMLPVGIGRNVNTRLAAVEALALVAGTASPELILRAAPGYAEVLVSQREQDMRYAAYGPRAAPSTFKVIGALRRDPTTRQAVVQIWKPEDLDHRGDRPCTLSLQFLIRDHRLELHVTMRSQDAWRGLAYDAFVFTQYQQSVLNELRRTSVHPQPDLSHLQLGQFVLHVGSFHLYLSDLSAVSKMLERFKAHDIRPPAWQDLPHGVDLTGTPHAASEIAAYLLGYYRLTEPHADRVAEANPWYAEQIDSMWEREVKS